MAIGYIYPTDAHSEPEGGPEWTDLEKTYDHDWESFGTLVLHRGDPIVWTYWEVDPVVTDRITLKGTCSAALATWFSLSVRLDGEWRLVWAGVNYFGTFTFPCGVVTGIRYIANNEVWLPEIVTIRIYEVALPFDVDFSGQPLKGAAPLEVTFTNLSREACVEPLSVLWDFGDESTYEGWNPPPHTYSKAGLYTVKLTIVWPGVTVTETKVNYIDVRRYDPDFEAVPLTGCAPLMVLFTGWDNGPLEPEDWYYEWDFGYDELSWWWRIGLNTFCPIGAFDVTLCIDDGVSRDCITKTAYIETTSRCPTCETLQATDEDVPWSLGADTDVLGNTIVCVFTHQYPNGVSFVRSDDRGKTWTEPVMLIGPNCYYMGRRPSVRIVDTNTIYVVWPEYRNITPRHAIYFAKSLDGGVTFSTPVLVTHSGEMSCYYTRSVRIAVDSEGRILLSWNYTSLCFASSEDSGATWINKQGLASFYSGYEGDIVCDSADGVFVICPAGGKVSLWVSEDHGITWSLYSVIETEDPWPSPTARITARGDDLYAVWLAETYDEGEDTYYWRVYSSRSEDHGATWSSPVRVDDTPDISDEVLDFDEGTLGIGFVGSALVVAWLPDWGYAPPLHVKASQDGGGTWGRLLKTCVTWYNYSFGIAFGSDYVAAGWTGTIDTDAWTDFLYVAVCQWAVRRAETYFLLA